MSKKMALGIGLGVLAAALLIWLLFLPQFRTCAHTKEELVKAQSEVKHCRELMAGRPLEERKLEELRRDPRRSSFNLDARQGADIILLGLESAARKVRVTSFEPGKMVEKQFLLCLPFQIGVEGSYPDVLSFVEGLETGAIRDLVEVRQLKLTNSSVPGVVVGNFAAVLNMDKTPETRLILEQVGKWSLGRPNVFQP